VKECHLRRSRLLIKYYVVNVTKVEPKHLKSIDQVKTDIASELRGYKSSNDNAKFAADVRHEIIANPLSASILVT
jgi:hypothetical protein